MLLQGLLAIALLGPGPDRPLRRRHDDGDDDRRAAPGRDRRGVRADGGRRRGGRVPARADGRARRWACWARSPSPRWRRCWPRPTTTTACSRLTLAVSYLPVAFALQAPQWVFFKRMEYVRLRSLQAIVPLGTVAVVVPLLLLGVEVWALVIGPFVRQHGGDHRRLAGFALPLRLRPDREAARRYLRFSWPVFVTAAISLFVLAGPDRGLRDQRRARRRGLDHARGDADPLRRPRRPDRRDDDLPGDRARARPRRRARGAVREGQPADADVGVPVRRRAWRCSAPT